MDTVRRGGKKNRKHGRNKKQPAKVRYTSERRWIKNKARKIRKYLKRHPNWRPYNISPEVERLLG